MEKRFIDVLDTYLKQKDTFTTQEIYALFSDMNRQTVSWHLHDELEKGNIEKVSHGVYCRAKSLPDQDERFLKISELSRDCYRFIESLGYDFYLTGLDCLNGLGFTVSGIYPVIICTRKHLMKDLQLELMREFDLAITEDELSMLDMDSIRSRIQFVILSSEDFKLQKSHFAVREKAFVDLYYAVTRIDYPVPVEELPHILGIIDPNKFRFGQSTKDRGLQNELNFLLNYNSHFIKSFAKYI